MNQQTTLTITGEEIAKLLTEWAKDHGYTVEPKSWCMKVGDSGPSCNYHAVAALAPRDVRPTPKEAPCAGR